MERFLELGQLCSTRINLFEFVLLSEFIEPQLRSTSVRVLHAAAVQSRYEAVKVSPSSILQQLDTFRHCLVLKFSE